MISRSLPAHAVGPGTTASPAETAEGPTGADQTGPTPQPVSGAPATRGWSGRTLGTRLGHASFLFMARFLPRPVVNVILLPVATFYFLFIPHARTGAAGYIRRRFGGRGQLSRAWHAWRHTVAFAHVLCDKAYLAARGPSAFQVQFPTTSNIRAALSRGKGAIILSAHVGSWDVASCFFGRLGTPVTVVMFEAERPEIRRLYRRKRRPDAPFRIVASNDAFEASLTVRQCLARNEIVVMHADRSASGSTFRCAFLGDPAPFPRFPFRVAAVTGAPVVCAFTSREGSGRYLARALEAIEVTRGSELRACETYVSALQEYVEQHPYQWFNFYNFWDDRDEANLHLP